VKHYFSLIKFSHTVFALPFALTGAAYAFTLPDAAFSWRILLLIVACMVFARSAAMAFNRYLDRDIDAQNARTAVREIPAGIVSPRNALMFTLLTSGLFVACSWAINPLCGMLSPVALLVVLGYSFTKRFTPLCHLVLGTGLALAPIGAFVAVTARFELAPVVLGIAVLCWVSGFDIIYALQDEAFDRSTGLNSIPVLLGGKRALLVSRLLHTTAAVAILTFGVLIHGNFMYWLGALVFVAMLVRQHTLVTPTDLSRVNAAFFTSNGIASVVYAVFVITGLVLKFSLIA
jgi:4-hydroxybenzoate polyprenyltransferase